MAQLLLVNPKRRGRRRKNPRRRRRSSRQMTAKQLKYFGKGRRRKNPRRRVHHVTRRRRINPRRRRRNPVRALSRRRRRNPVRHHRRRRRNPISAALGGGFVANSVMCAATGTVGALVSDIAWNFIPIPATYKTGNIGALAKAAVTLVGGMFSAKLVGQKIARDATVGALTVQLYSFAKPMLVSAGVPGLSGMGYYGAGYALNSFVPNSLNAFVPNSLNDYTDVGDTSNYPPDYFEGKPGSGMSEYISQYISG